MQRTNLFDVFTNVIVDGAVQRWLLQVFVDVATASRQRRRHRGRRHSRPGCRFGTRRGRRRRVVFPFAVFARTRVDDGRRRPDGRTTAAATVGRPVTGHCSHRPENRRRPAARPMQWVEPRRAGTVVGRRRRAGSPQQRHVSAVRRSVQEQRRLLLLLLLLLLRGTYYYCCCCGRLRWRSKAVKYVTRGAQIIYFTRDTTRVRVHTKTE